MQQMNINIKSAAAKPLHRCDIEQVNDFCGAYLGKGLYTPESLAEIAKTPNRFFYAFFDGGEIAAIFYCYCDTGENAAADISEKILDYCGRDEKVGVFRSIAVDPKYRGTGLSEQLLDAFGSALFNDYRVSRIFALAWIKGDFIPAGKLLNGAGFSAACRISRPWYGVENMVCPFCGGRCRCDGELYMKLRESD